MSGRKKKIRVNDTVKLMFMIGLLITCILWLNYPFIDQEAVEEMNKMELHYDADDYFIMVNESEGLLGVYKATTPIRHFRCKVADDEQVDFLVVEVTALTQCGVTLRRQDLTWILDNCPDWTPVLIYQG